MEIRLDVDDRIAAALGGMVATCGAAATALVLLRGHARVQAARNALLGRPVAYRLHLRGTGIELAPWERNLVAECVIRGTPADGIYMGPDVPIRPDLGGSVIRDTMVTGSRGAGISVPYDAPTPYDEDDDLALDALNDVMRAGDETGAHYLTATCPEGHTFEARNFVRLGDRATYTQRDLVTLTCPEHGTPAEIPPGRYTVQDGEVVREDLPVPDDEY